MERKKSARVLRRKSDSFIVYVCFSTAYALKLEQID